MLHQDVDIAIGGYILEAWKSLPSKDKTRLEKERLDIENKHAETIAIAASELAKSC